MTDAEKAAREHMADFFDGKDYDPCHERYLGFLAGYSAAQTWRPIESAPRDGSRVLVKVGVSWPMFASFRIVDLSEPPRDEDLHHYKKEWRTFSGNVINPTGWFQLPPSE